jgi:hypothetical protein
VVLSRSQGVLELRSILSVSDAISVAIAAAYRSLAHLVGPRADGKSHRLNSERVPGISYT